MARQTTKARQTARRTAHSAGRRSVRPELDPTFYADVFAFRKAVAAGTVDVSKGCRDMDEYMRSVSHG